MWASITILALALTKVRDRSRVMINLEYVYDLRIKV